MTGTTNPTPARDYDAELRSLAATFAAVGAQVESSSTSATLQAIITMVLDRLPAPGASITTIRWGRFRTAASSSEQAAQADQLQYRLNSGPCIDAILENTHFHPEDLSTDPRWPQFGPAVVAQHGFASMLSYRLSFKAPAGPPPDGQKTSASLNIYGRAPGAFSEADQSLGLLLATHAAIALVAANGWQRSRQLGKALESNRDIGVALGVLMGQSKVTRVQAFDLLRIASQNRNRKLRHLAHEVADTGTPRPGQRPGYPYRLTLPAGTYRLTLPAGPTGEGRGRTLHTSSMRGAERGTNVRGRCRPLISGRHPPGRRHRSNAPQAGPGGPAVTPAA